MAREPLRVAVVTGGHPYDVQNFHRLFWRFDEFDAFIQHMDDFAWSPVEARDSYDVIVFYTMLMETPPEGETWPHGDPHAAITRLGATKQGILVLHHAILAYPQWPVWSALVGIPKREFQFFVGENVHVEIADPKHPITKGLKAWDMTDETYTMPEPGADSRVILTVEHPKSMKAIGWTRQHGQGRVFCLQSGHDNATWENANFRKVLERGILWCARRI